MTTKESFTSEIIMICRKEMTSEQIRFLENVMHERLDHYELNEKETQKQLPAEYFEANQELLNRFLIAKTVQGLSNRSVSLYAFHLRGFVSQMDKILDDVTSDDIRLYLARYKKMRDVSNTYLQNIHRCLASFFGWLVIEELIDKNPMIKLKPIKADSIKEQPFTQEEIEKMRMSCDTIRDRALLEFLISTGCRVSEVSDCNIDDVDKVNKEVFVIGKGMKARTTFLTDSALLYLDMYLKTRTDRNRALFATTRIVDGEYRRMTPEMMEARTRAIGTKAGVDNCHPHRFRRTCCNMMIRRGANIEDVKEVLGHSKLDTTLIYMNNSKENVKSAYKKAFC